ncbi:hypothetical protein N7532_005687 [Penicillium argentinense]|uniref:DUF4604 domain-containing protein n=1 Tax=Penicillium argentinense TaxID=1131581 RepID=A0A9W9KAM1_9EURO|nr:uncharacterized protein N7532_005687 [Penicillium argentinense]KAJ5098686.1 hypothetical protein N7532_005687 [Penicillium argentinense]
MSKNPKLAYEANEPAFLQKLRGQYGNNNGRLERPAARPRKLKDSKDEDDDEPVYVDEESNEVISKEEYKALVKSDEPNQNGDESTNDQTTADGEKPTPKAESEHRKQTNLTEVGGQKKRKQAKVVGEDQPPPEEQQEKPKTPVSKKPEKAKKAKKIKLSFDEE